MKHATMKPGTHEVTRRKVAAAYALQLLAMDYAAHEGDAGCVLQLLSYVSGLESGDSDAFTTRELGGLVADYLGRKVPTITARTGAALVDFLAAWEAAPTRSGGWR